MEIVVAGYLVKAGHIIAVVSVVIVGIVVFKMLKPKEQNPHLSRVRCACGWTGEVSKYHPVCPKCGKQLQH